MHATAIVMNMFYTGLGIARSLGEHGIPVIGLTAKPGIYGNYTRYAKIVVSPDSRDQPEALLNRLMELGKELGHRAVIFPTRDDDVIFLDRYRKELSPYFILTVPESAAIQGCLDKWETYLAARKANVQTPRCWLIENENDLRQALPNLVYPCVVKPVAAYHWRKSGHWALVGGRKAIGIHSEEELLSEYKAISRADTRMLVQELVAGDDQCLVIAACYFDRQSNFVAGFNLQKVLQVPQGFGTGCIVQATNRAELFEPAIRLLQEIRYTGIAEVEYKWDATTRQYQLIEVNPRPWDQHRLGRVCGVDLVYLAYLEHAGLPLPVTTCRERSVKWVAEDGFITAVLQSIWRRDGSFRRLLRLARGSRTYAIWSWRDPLPFLVYMSTRFVPALVADGFRLVWSRLSSKLWRRNKSLVYEG